MANAKETTLYITISVIVFVIGKIVIALLLYKRWKRKHTVHENGFPGKDHLDLIYVNDFSSVLVYVFFLNI